MNNQPLITVITISFNAIRTIENTILSVINQTYPNIEYLIIDGGSTDGTIDIIKKYADNISYWISEPDKGIYDAMNKGIDVATGKYINFMNCGDRFYSNTTIQDIINIANPNSDIIYGNTCRTFDIGEFIKKGQIATPKNYMPFGHQASFTKTSLMLEYHFDTYYKICADRDFFYKAYKHNKKFEYIDITVCYYEAENGFSATNIKKLLYEKGEIEGKNHTLRWKFKYYSFIIQFNIKNSIKKILPKSKIDTYRYYKALKKSSNNK